MRVVITANVILGGLPRRPGHVYESLDVDYCGQLIERGLARAEEPEATPPTPLAPAQPSSEPHEAEAVEAELAPTTAAEPDAAPEAAPVETKAQRKARERAEREAKQS